MRPVRRQQKGNAQRVSEVETEILMSAMLQDYDVVPSEQEYERSPPILELAEHYREYILNRSTQSPPTRRTLPTPPVNSPPPLRSAMDIPSVCFRPVPVMAQAVMTSTQGHPSSIGLQARNITTLHPGVD